jgi:serine-type D-Ala-D-Ala carboxypeptidase/endopeptidase (penicillin-binding protein 4)
LPYSAHISAFSINDNCVEVKVSANTAPGEPGVVEVTPRTGYVTIVNETRTTQSDQSSLSVGRSAGSNTIVLSGTVSGYDSPKAFAVTVHKPPLYGATMFKEVLETRGIAVRGTIRVINEDQRSRATRGRVLVSHSSPPLSAIINLVNKRSHNLSAELLLRTLGAVYYGKGTTRNGVLAVEETLQRSGVVPEEIRIRDGSGLSRLSMVTPSQIVDLLEFMYHQPVFPHFYDSLPIAGVDGSLAVRMVGTKAEKRVRAKTGSSTHVSSLSGYVRKDDGEMIAFAILTNNNPKPILEIRRLQDALCEWLSAPHE